MPGSSRTKKTGLLQPVIISAIDAHFLCYQKPDHSGRFHKTIVPSLDPDANTDPSGDQANAYTQLA
jgi:hypothetical protein